LFLGHHPTQLKSSNRLSLPTGWRKLLTGGIYLTQGFDQNLLILTAETFQEIYERITSLNITDPLARLLLRMFLGTASYMELKESEAISVPQSLMDYADLRGRVVLVGQGEYLEIWSPGHWAEQEAQIQDAQANAARFSAFHIATRTQVSLSS
jgi:MraZ protein